MLNMRTISSPALLGFGAYEQGVCADGADYVCSSRNGEYSCRPCDYAQLAMFKELQNQINRLIMKYGLGRQIAVDGRIGDDTTRAAGAVYRASKGSYAPSASVRPALEAALASPDSASSMQALASVADETTPFFAAIAAAEGAPPTSATNPAKPSADAGPYPQLPPRVTDQGTLEPSDVPAGKRGRGGLVFLGVLAMLGAVGLVGTAHYYGNNKKKRRFLPNLHEQRFWLEEEKRWISLRVSGRGTSFVALT